MTGPYFSNEEWKEKLKHTTSTKEFKMENAKPHDEYRITEREMYERDQRLSCLSHAIDVNRIDHNPDKIIERAKSYYDFIEKGK